MLGRGRAQALASDAATDQALAAMPTAELLRQRDRLQAGTSERTRVERELNVVIAQRQRAEKLVAASREPPTDRRPTRRKGRDAGSSAAQDAVAAQAADRARALAQRENELRVRLGQQPDLASDRPATLSVIDNELARRRTNAARIVAVQPSPYLVAELGPVPERLTERRAWQRAARRIEMYREDFEVNDPHSAHGPQPRELGQRDAWRIVRRDVDAARAELPRDRGAEHPRSRGFERDLG